MKKSLPFVLFLLLWTFAATMAPQFGFYFLLSTVLGLNLSLPVLNCLYSLLSYGTAIFLILYVPYKLFRQKRLTREDLGLKGLPKWADLGLAPVGFVVYIVTATALTFLFSKIPGFQANEAQNLGISTSLPSVAERLFAFVALCVIAPLAEEFIFRGFLYARLRAKIHGKGSMFVSMVLTSLLFAVLHGQLNVAVNVFCLSMVLCGLREVTGTIYAGIFLHILKNVVAFYILYVV